MGICLIAVLGTGLLCSGGDKHPAVVSDGCLAFGPDITRLGRFTDTEITALSRTHKEAVVSLKRKKAKLCK